MLEHGVLICSLHISSIWLQIKTHHPPPPPSPHPCVMDIEALPPGDVPRHPKSHNVSIAERTQFAFIFAGILFSQYQRGIFAHGSHTSFTVLQLGWITARCYFFVVEPNFGWIRGHYLNSLSIENNFSSGGEEAQLIYIWSNLSNE